MTEMKAPTPPCHPEERSDEGFLASLGMTEETLGITEMKGPR
jgi:hypothetical protein